MSRQDGGTQELRQELAAPADEVREAVAEVAEAWGAEWEPASGRLALPLSAGLRRGWGEGELQVEPTAAGCLIRLRLDERHFRLRGAAVVVLILAGLGGLVAALWPLFPVLLPLAPIGVVLAVSAWFLVLARLTNSGAEEFLQAVTSNLEARELESTRPS